MVFVTLRPKEASMSLSLQDIYKFRIVVFNDEVIEERFLVTIR